jgi:hypothetical protein
MGIYTNGKIYGVTWYNLQGDSGDTERYEKKYTDELTEEQRQEIYADFVRLVPEKDQPQYYFRVYTRCFTTYEPVSSFQYNWMWWPLDYVFMMEYFEKGAIVGF